MRIAIVGSGVSGLVVAHLLHRRHEVTVFEASDHVGGHVHTHEVSVGGGTISVDTGFIVYNERTYPNFTSLLGQLGVATQPSTMSFSVRLREPELEYNGSTLRQLFAQRRNLVRPWFYAMIADILRFNRQAPVHVLNGAASQTLGEYVSARRYSRPFIDRYLLPMAAAIWSMPQRTVLEMPAAFFVRFFANHGMLSIDDRPEWRTVTGGSARYVEVLSAPFADRIRLRSPVRDVKRFGDHVTVDGVRYDHVVFACHSDQALAALADASHAERAILGSLPYQENAVVLHSDVSVLPKRRRAWAAWNYHLSGAPSDPVAVTYNMNILQALDAGAGEPFCVTLNETDHIDPARVIAKLRYAHPVFTREGVAAQQRHGEISGVRRTHYCGAYWGFGFHEDGVNSALAVGKAFGEAL